MISIIVILMLVAAAILVVTVLTQVPATQPAGQRNLAWAVLLIAVAVAVIHLVPVLVIR